MIIFDNTVLDKSHSHKIERVRRQYSGNAHGLVKGISAVANAVKSLFHNGAMSAIQHPNYIKTYYEQKVAKSKHKMLVINNNGAIRSVGTSYFGLCISKTEV